MEGYCSNCHKVWTLETRQGICQWCSREASCLTTLTKPRQLKSSRSRRRKQVDNGNNGYDQLPEPYLTYYKVALRFARKALIDDTQDLLHDIIEGLARVAEHKTLSEAAMYRLAEHIKDHYWYRHYAYHNGLDCQHCSKAQRAKCRANWAYSDCPRAITLESINQTIIDSEGNITELAELIADDKALDLAEWLDAKTFLIGAPIRLKQIARKLYKGEALTYPERNYLSRLRKKRQLALTSDTF
ncbi:MAG: hypothetical protein J7L92_02795 [Dehalococcoidia bacterium]|nr:hypothetical protein [Dehalococcoidia bacterium]